jgi:hypothetical protein
MEASISVISRSPDSKLFLCASKGKRTIVEREHLLSVLRRGIPSNVTITRDGRVRRRDGKAIPCDVLATQFGKSSTKTIYVSSAVLSGDEYCGTRKKTGILLDGSAWFVKERGGNGTYFDHVSEHIASQIIKSLGIDAQDTLLVVFHGAQAVAVKDFVPRGATLTEFGDTGDSTTYDEPFRDFAYSINNVLKFISANSKLEDRRSAEQWYLQLLAADILIDNVDRHSHNWGFIRRGNSYRMSPVFDSGSSLYYMYGDKQLRAFNRLADADLLQHIDKHKVAVRASDGGKYPFAVFVRKYKDSYLKDALVWLRRSLDWHKVDDIIDRAAFCSVERGEFLKRVLRLRAKYILGV